MAIQHTESVPAAPLEQGREYISPEELERKVPLQVWQAVRRHLSDGATASPEAAYSGTEFTPSLVRRRRKNQFFFTELHQAEALQRFRNQLYQLNHSMELNECMVGCIEEQQGAGVSGLARLFRPAHKKPKKAFSGPDLETCGRLFAHGFRLVDTFESGGASYFIAEKVKHLDKPPRANEGSFIRLRRIGQGGKAINVYKLRTMFPYSEYLQEYIYEMVGLQSGGKMKNDPRITPVGRVCRRYWLDELPMLLNVLRGELRLIGVRPISAHYLSLYPEEFRNYRCRFKPGLLPPFYYDLPSSLDEIIASERRYLESFEKQPWLTDLRYLMVSAYNILFKGVRSY